MSVNRTELVAQIAERADLTKAKADEALAAFQAVLVESLAKGEAVKVTGLLSVERVERAAQISLSNRRQVTVMPAVKRRHLDQQKTVAEADLRAIMATPHKQVDKATLAQMVIVMGAAGLDRLLVLQCDFAKW